MTFPFYSGEGKVRAGFEQDELPWSRLTEQVRPEGYLADPGLKDAVNVALLSPRWFGK